MLGIAVWLRCLLLDPCIWFSIENDTLKTTLLPGGVWKTEWG